MATPMNARRRPTPPTDEVVIPRVPEWREKLIRTVAVIAVVYACYWVWWRWTHTINTDPVAVVPSIILLLAESWAFIGLCSFVFLTWRLTNRSPPPPPPGLGVDVFITNFDEPLEVLRRTAIGARAIRYPHRTYMLDDGKREDVRAMAEELGIGYIRRVTNTNAKAGNLNFALSVTTGEFILQLDADHVPHPTIVDRLVGYFEDPLLAMVQAPQDFYNVDSFTHVVNDEGRRLWEENRIFYALIQPGRDHWNASFFCGSCGMIRRSALEAIGGFASQTIIEDMETTIQLHARGYKTAYHRETLAYGLAPGSAGAYHVQRMRWGQGAMQVLRKLKPLTMRTLTLPQRLAYFAGTVCYFEGWQKAVFYLTPLLFFFTGILPIAGSQEAFLTRLVPYLILSVLAFELLARGTGYILLSERFTMVRVWTYMLAALAIFTRKPLRFNVTPKGHSSVPRSAYIPQLVLLGLSIAAPIWATVAHTRGWINYDASGWGSVAFWMNGGWALWNCYFAFFVVRHTLRMRQQRDDHRFVDQVPIQVRLANELSRDGVPALTADLNPNGLAFRATQQLDPGTRVEIRLPLGPKMVPVAGIVRHVAGEETRLGAVFMHGVEFDSLPMEDRDAIELYCTQHSMPMWRMRYRQSIDIFTRATEVMQNLRGRRRRLAGLPARVHLGTAGSTGDNLRDPAPIFILEEISDTGARLVGEAPIAPGTSVRFDVPGTNVSGAGIVRHVQTLQTRVSILFSMGVEFDAAPAAARRWRPSDHEKKSEAYVS
ncbi:MAG: glycosyltransferase [Gemmatimonadaceae bacterium]